MAGYFNSGIGIEGHRFCAARRLLPRALPDPAPMAGEAEPVNLPWVAPQQGRPTTLGEKRRAGHRRTRRSPGKTGGRAADLQTRRPGPTSHPGVGPLDDAKVKHDRRRTTPSEAAGASRQTPATVPGGLGNRTRALKV